MLIRLFLLGNLWGLLLSVGGYAFAAEVACSPDVPIIDIPIISQKPAPTVKAELIKLFEEDQGDREELSKPGTAQQKWQAIAARDVARRTRVLKMLEKMQITDGDGLFFAAVILQHGNCSSHYKLAVRLAGTAIALGYDDGRLLYADAVDRYLMSLNKPQKFGTQYTLRDGKKQLIGGVDQNTTNLERAKYNVPPID
jgi:hypothetical protein